MTDVELIPADAIIHYGTMTDTVSPCGNNEDDAWMSLDWKFVTCKSCLKGRVLH